MGALLLVLLKEVAPILIKNVLIPEVLRIVKKRQEASAGKWPTEEEVFEDLKKNILEGITAGESFLQRTEPNVKSGTKNP